MDLILVGIGGFADAIARRLMDPWASDRGLVTVERIEVVAYRSKP